MQYILIFIVSLCLLSSCGSGGDTFRLEGRLKNTTQAELIVYSPDGGMMGMDTIKVRDKRFSYELPVSEKKTLIIAFLNNLSEEYPVFVEPGATVTVSNFLSEMEGTEENELYSGLRRKTKDMSRDEAKKAIATFVNEHPKTIACRYLIDKYFIKTSTPDYRQALTLTETCLKADPENARLQLLKNQLEGLQAFGVGNMLPEFTVGTIGGDTVTLDSMKAKVNIVSVWASWNNRSTNNQRLLKNLKKEYGDSIAILSICIDGDSAKCRRMAKSNATKIHEVCDGKMWDTPLLHTFGLSTAEGNIIADKNGKIVAVNVINKEIRDKVTSIMK